MQKIKQIKSHVVLLDLLSYSRQFSLLGYTSNLILINVPIDLF